MEEKKRTYYCTLLLGLMLLLGGEVVGAVMTAIVSTILPASGELETFMLYFSFIGIWAFVLAYIFFMPSNKPLLKQFWKGKKGNTISGFLIGLLLGGGLNAICAFVAIIRGDVRITFSEFNPLWLILILFAVCVQSGAEELVCRGFIYERLLVTDGPVAAIILNSVLFGVLHLGNDGVTVLSIINIVVVGILTSFMVYYLNSFWMAIAFHTAWNFTQNIIFGLPNSGMLVPFSIFKIEGTPTKSFAYDPGFGIEGTILADAILIITSAIIVVFAKLKAAKKS